MYVYTSSHGRTFICTIRSGNFLIISVLTDLIQECKMQHHPGTVSTKKSFSTFFFRS